MKTRVCVVLVLPACRLDVHSVDLAPVAEVVAPHPQAAAAVDADLEDVDVLPDESRQVPDVGVEVVRPFPDAGA